MCGVTFWYRTIPLMMPISSCLVQHTFRSDYSIMSDKRFSELIKEKGSPLPKFGEWDVNDPASAEGFTVIFNKARDEKKTGGNSQGQDVPAKSEQPSGQGFYAAKGKSSKKWFCCLQPTAAES